MSETKKIPHACTEKKGRKKVNHVNKEQKVVFRVTHSRRRVVDASR